MNHPGIRVIEVCNSVCKLLRASLYFYHKKWWFLKKNRCWKRSKHPKRIGQVSLILQSREKNFAPLKLYRSFQFINKYLRVFVWSISVTYSVFSLNVVLLCRIIFCSDLSIKEYHNSFEVDLDKKKELKTRVGVTNCFYHVIKSSSRGFAIVALQKWFKDCKLRTDDYNTRLIPPLPPSYVSSSLYFLVSISTSKNALL
jgi:hypothetical protein